MSDPYLYYKSIKDTPVSGHLDFNCLKLKYEVLKLGVLMSDPYLYYNSIKDTPVCGHLNFNCLKLKYEVNHDILVFILAPGYTVSTWGCVVLTVYDKHRCQTIARYTGKPPPPPFKGQNRIYPCPAEPRINPCPVDSIFENTRS